MDELRKAIKHAEQLADREFNRSSLPAEWSIIIAVRSILGNCNDLIGDAMRIAEEK